MKRIVTGLVGAAISLLAVFGLPSSWFLLVLLAMSLVAGAELVSMLSHRAWAPALRILFVAVPLVVVPLSGVEWPGADWFSQLDLSDPALLAAAVMLLTFLLVLGALLLRTPPERGLETIAGLSFGVPYLSLAVLGLFRIRELDPWLLFLLLAIVWLGDSAALYGGKTFGRRKLAPNVSPNKTWEGAFSGLLASVSATAIFSFVRLGHVDGSLLGLAAVVAVVAQLGDLVESLIKRSVDIKDSGSLLPGHGGMLDRMDALFFSAPFFWLGLLALGSGRFLVP